MNDKSRPTFAFSLNWKITLASLVFFPVLIALGVWQLQRATEKQTILDSWYAQQALPATAIESLANAGDINTPLKIHGRFDAERYWLLENRFYQGNLGDEVIMVLHTDAGEQVLVNRGWVAGSARREVLPEFSTPGETVQLQGYLKEPQDLKMLEEKPSADVEWPRRVLELHPERMSVTYGQALFDKILQLDAASPGALKVSPSAPINMTPAKHRAYAFQWFALAFALALLWLFANSNLVQVIKHSREK